MATNPDQRTLPWGRIVRGLIALATVAFIAVLVADRLDELDEVDLRLRWGYLVAAVPPAAAAGVVLPLAWRALVQAWGASLGVGDAVRIWVLSQATRYLPTGLVAVASRLTLAGDAGVPRGVAATTFVLEAAYLALWSGLLGLALVPSGIVPAPWRLLGVAGCAMGLLLLPPLLSGAARVAGRRDGPVARLVERGGGVPSRSGLSTATAWFGLNAALRVAASLLVAAAVLDLDPGAIWSASASTAAGDARAVAGAVAIAVVLGLVGITPAGIGVREGVIAGLLADRFGLGDAAALAVVLRLFELAVELVFVAVAVLLVRRRGSGDPGPG